MDVWAPAAITIQIKYAAANEFNSWNAFLVFHLLHILFSYYNNKILTLFIR